MKNLILLAAAGLCLAACAPGGKAAIVKACVDDGTERKTCECMAKELEAKVDKEAFQAMVLGAQGKDAEAEAILKKLPMDKQFSVATGAMSAAMTCGLS